MPEPTIIPHVMFIDPGFSGTGIAVWTLGAFKQALAGGPFVPPVFHKSFSRKDLGCYVTLLRELIGEYGVVGIWCENAAYHGTGSVKGQMVAAKGDLVRLAQIIGAYEAIAHIHGVDFVLVPVTTWKGQLPKEVVQKRVLKVWPSCDCTNHDWDAVGIGMYCMCVINQKMDAPAQ